MNQSSNTAHVYTVDEARAAVIAAIPPPIDTEQIPLSEALGRITAKAFPAAISIPPFRNSAMDGYAIRWRDYQLSSTFKVAGSSLAGHPFEGEVPLQHTIKITTGAMVPPDTDTIVIVENTTQTDDTMVINKPPEQHQYIRNVGDDVTQGSIVIAANTRLKPAHLGLLAAQGANTIEVFRQAKIGVFSTGDELCESGQTLSDGAIYDSNRISICTMLRRAGFQADDLGIARDSKADIQQLLLNHQKNYDFLLSSGGVSVGEADYVKATLEANGTLQFWKVAMKPGKPMVTGKLKSGAYYFGLPGNPVSSMVTCAQFVIPAVGAFEGAEYNAPPIIRANCQTTLQKEAGRFEFQRGRYSIDSKGSAQVTTTGLQDSHVLHSMGEANCFICLEAQSTGAKTGEMVNVMLFDTIPGLQK